MIAGTGSHSVFFRGEAVTINSIFPAHQDATAIIIDRCTSTSWSEIGNALASLNQLHSLILRDCETGISLWEKLFSSKSLRRLHMGTHSRDTESCDVTESDLNEITKLTQLEDLTLGKSYS